jgi:hypothetical protein
MTYPLMHGILTCICQSRIARHSQKKSQSHTTRRNVPLVPRRLGKKNSEVATPVLNNNPTYCTWTNREDHFQRPAARQARDPALPQLP